MRQLSTLLLILILNFSACSGKSGAAEEPKKEPETNKQEPVNESAIAFPGAAGGGMNTTGGRGGKVYVITSLEDTNTAGTLRYAVNQSGARYIVFAVSGTIQLNSDLSIRNGNLTIAGQTAPGDGICLAGFPLYVDADNVIVRFMRVRMGNKKNINSDGADAMGGRKRSNVIIDHCSISWSTDECASFYDNKNFTMQWCIVSESMRMSSHSKGAHGYGGIWGGVNASFHHNLMAHHESRTPRFGPGEKYQGTDITDARNNVYYNWSGSGCYGGEAMNINIVNNYYKPGPATTGSIANRVIGYDVKAANETGGFAPIASKWGKLYINGNYFPTNATITADNWAGVSVVKKEASDPVTKETVKSLTPFATTEVPTHSAQTAYLRVLDFAGCSLVRDEIDKRIINETRTGTAAYKGASANKPGIIDSQEDTRPAGAAADWSAWPELKTTAPKPDADADGMPDEWERSAGLNPEKADATGRDLSTGYDNIEVYINSLVKEMTENQYK